MASSIDHKESDAPCKRRKLPLSLPEVASKKELHHHLPALLSWSNVNIQYDDLYYYGRTALLMALLEGCSLETFNVLRAAGADMRVTDLNGDNALHCALLGDCSNDVIYQLLRYNYDLLYQKNAFAFANALETPLHVAAKKNRLDHILPTILQDKKIYLKDPEGLTPLLLALYVGCSLETYNGLRKAGADIREKDKEHNNALHYALQGGCSYEVIDQLLECSSQMMYEENRCRQTPLSKAAKMERFHHFIPFILKDGQVNYEDSEGKTPILYALSSGCSLEDFKLLKEAGANLSVQYKRDINALYCALEGDCSDEVISELLNYNWKMIYGTTFENEMFVDDFNYIIGDQALHLAARKNRLHVFVPFIVEHNMVNCRDSNGRTLMHLAVRHDCLRSVEAILQFISPILLNERDTEGYTCLNFAVGYVCSSAIIRTLLNAGLNPATRDENGLNALHMLVISSLRGFHVFNSYLSVLKEILRGHPEIVGDRSHGILLPLECPCPFPSDVTICTLKWTLLQNDAGFQWRTLLNNAPGEDIVSFVEDCNSDLDLLRAYMVTETLSLYDLVKSCYVSPNFINELRREIKFVRVLQFQGNLRVYEDEVKEIVRMVRVCSSLYGMTLPFPAFKNGNFVHLSKKVLDYLSIDDLEQFAMAVNIKVK